MIQYLLNYLLIGLFYGLFMNITIDFLYKKGESVQKLNPIESVLVVILWPIYATVFFYSLFFKNN